MGEGSLVYSIGEVAKVLGISRNNAYYQVSAGTLPGAIRLGKRIVVSKFAINKYLETHKEPVKESVPRKAQHGWESIPLIEGNSGSVPGKAQRGQKPIAEDKIISALALFKEHPDYGWDKIGEHTGVNPSTLRHIFKRRWGYTARNRGLGIITVGQSREVDSPPETAVDGTSLPKHISDNEITSFYVSKGDYNKDYTCKTFGISLYKLSHILIRSGHPELAYPSMVPQLGVVASGGINKHLNGVKVKPDIQPNVQIDETLIDSLIQRLQKYEDLKQKYIALGQKHEALHQAHDSLEDRFADLQVDRKQYVEKIVSLQNLLARPD